MLIIDFSLSFYSILILILWSTTSFNSVCLASFLVEFEELSVLGYSRLEQEQSWLQSKFIQLVLEPAICHYIRRPTFWAALDKINFTMHQLVSFDVQSWIHIVNWNGQVVEANCSAGQAKDCVCCSHQRLSVVMLTVWLWMVCDNWKR